MPLPPGTLVGPYEILAPLGAGGMGEVYRARDPRLGREVAVKLLRDEPRGESARRRLLREARTASQLSHPNICAVFDVGEADGRVFFAMELLPGRTLAEAARPSGLPVEDLVRHAIAIAAALEHAHRRGVVHCDLKPANVVITDAGAKVLDFGIARRETAVDTETMTRSCQDGRVLGGTPAYMAPEQLRLQEPDERTDVWALGVLLFEAATGRLPFEGATLQDLATAVLRDPPAPLPAHVPPGLRAVIEKCLRKDPAQRYQRASEVQAALEATGASGVQVEPPRQSEAPGRRVRLLAWGAVALLLASAVAVGFSWRRRPVEAAPAVARRLAILPLRALNQEAADDFLGLGIADAVITKASQFPGLTVLPTNAVRAFARGDGDPMQAARKLHAAIVLDGTVQHAGGRVKVSVNLLDAHDGSSIWADSFEASVADVFAVQEEIARAIATRLRVRLGPVEQAAIARRYTSNADAYAAFTKGMYHLANRGFDPQARLESDTAIALFRQALSLDPGFARARAQLAYALFWTAIFYEDNRELVAEASRELDVAGRQDPNLADVHQARALILWSSYQGWRTEDAIREVQIAQRLDPSVGSQELSALYFHSGLDELGERFARRALALDPACENCKDDLYDSLLNSLQLEKAEGVRMEFWNQPPGADYYLLERRPSEAEPLVRKAEQDEPGSSRALTLRALLDAEQGRAASAEASIRRMLELTPRNRSYHHATYAAAEVYSLVGKPHEAVACLKESRDNGFSSYPTLERDRLLDPIRRDPEFVALLAEARTRWERLAREFGGTVPGNRE